MPGESQVIPAGSKLSKDQMAKIENGWEFVEVPERDTYDYEFSGFWINGEHFKPGKHLLQADWAAEAKRILKVWDNANRRLLRTTPHNKSVAEVSDGVLAPPPAEA